MGQTRDYNLFLIIVKIIRSFILTYRAVNKSDNEACKNWLWTTENIAKAKVFVDENGVGNVENPNALITFYITFGPK